MDPLDSDTTRSQLGVGRYHNCEALCYVKWEIALARGGRPVWKCQSVVQLYREARRRVTGLVVRPLVRVGNRDCVASWRQVIYQIRSGTALCRETECIAVKRHLEGVIVVSRVAIVDDNDLSRTWQREEVAEQWDALKREVLRR